MVSGRAYFKRGTTKKPMIKGDHIQSLPHLHLPPKSQQGMETGKPPWGGHSTVVGPSLRTAFPWRLPVWLHPVATPEKARLLMTFMTKQEHNGEGPLALALAHIHIGLKRS